MPPSPGRPLVMWVTSPPPPPPTATQRHPHHFTPTSDCCFPLQQIFNILCEHPETVAAYLVPRARAGELPWGGGGARASLGDSRAAANSPPASTMRGAAPGAGHGCPALLPADDAPSSPASACLPAVVEKGQAGADIRFLTTGRALWRFLTAPLRQAGWLFGPGACCARFRAAVCIDPAPSPPLRYRVHR